MNVGIGSAQRTRRRRREEEAFIYYAAYLMSPAAVTKLQLQVYST
jgi:hypothetical protein